MRRGSKQDERDYRDKKKKGKRSFGTQTPVLERGDTFRDLSIGE